MEKLRAALDHISKDIGAMGELFSPLWEQYEWKKDVWMRDSAPLASSSQALDASFILMIIILGYQLIGESHAGLQVFSDLLDGIYPEWKVYE